MSSDSQRYFEDLQARGDYARANPFCEIAICRLPELAQFIRCSDTASEIHHIASGLLGTRRYDLVTNMISLCGRAHAFCERYKHDGLAICSAVKLAKSPPELDVPLLSQIIRVQFLGHLEVMEVHTPVGELCQRFVLEKLSGGIA
jgi:hypothetical protein